MNTKKFQPLVLFLLGFTLFLFTRFSLIIPSIIPGGLAMIIAPVFILRFVRIQKFRKAIWFTLLGFLLSANISLWGIFDTGVAIQTAIFSLIRSSLIAVIYFIPYLIDRSIYPRLNGTVSTLSFPVSVTAILFLVSLEGPFDGSGISGVFAYGPLFFKQIASIAGLSGFVFVYSWFASALNYCWESRFAWGKIKKVTIIYTSVLLVISIYGVIKISPMMAPGSDTVKVAAILVLQDKDFVVEEEAFFTNKTHPFDETMAKIEKSVKKAASNGAKIVSTQETAIKIRDTEEPELFEKAKEIATGNNVYFSLAYGVLPEQEKGWNKHILISNQGEVQINYNKRFLLGLGDLFGESIIFKKGEEVIQVADTPYGRIGASICKDMEFAKYARQAGRKGVDIMLSPSYDYPTSRSAGNPLRPIETGFSFLRPSYNGLSHAQDYNGNIIARMHSDRTEDGIMYAEVPTKGVRTIYSYVGDLLAWFCSMAMFVLIIFGIVKKLEAGHN